ncbi:MAG TPA: hypothetical protein VGC65_02315 [Bacteroidia bacterium]|jgi:ElaB/YqjD/DUF883 family membrane-anchored ribosome-binding protein
MNINKNNYEAFFLDYYEGNLSPQQVADLLLFVEQHPEFREEFESFENLTLKDFSSVTFENKADLKKEITANNREDYFIRSVEKTLTPAEQLLLTTFIKQHPQYSAELELFQKTKLPTDLSIVYENKEALKHIAIDADLLLIASVEGLLKGTEADLFQQQLSVDTDMQHQLSLYQQTLLTADLSIVYKNKEELKRKEKRIIPFFYYVSGVAAAVILLVGLFFLFNNTKKIDPQFAKDYSPKKENPVPSKNESLPNQSNVLNGNILASSSVNSSKTKKQITTATKNDSLLAPVINQQQNNIADFKPEHKQEPELNNQKTIAKNTPQVLTNKEQLVAGNQKNGSQKATEDFLSLREFALEKIKEKTLDNNTVAVQKENGRIKRFSGWDVAQIVTRGISKLTGRDVEIKPKYNNQGDVTAYALGDNLQIARGK